MRTIMRWNAKMVKRVLGLISIFMMTGPVLGTEVSTFSLGRASQPGLYYPPAFMHGVNAFDSIRITFNEDVFVDFYDLQLQVVGDVGNSIPITGFTYDASTRAAVWTIDSQGTQQNVRYLATLRGVFDAGGVPLSGGTYTNAFTILTCDVTGDDQISPTDVLVIINHLNGGLPYNPVLDVDWNGVINPTDTLLIINYLNLYGNVALVPPGDYRNVPMFPSPYLAMTSIREQEGNIVLKLSGQPLGSYVRVMGKKSLLDAEWYLIVGYFVTTDSPWVSFSMLPGLKAEFYHASFQ